MTHFYTAASILTKKKKKQKGGGGGISLWDKSGGPDKVHRLLLLLPLESIKTRALLHIAKRGPRPRSAGAGIREGFFFFFFFFASRRAVFSAIFLRCGCGGHKGGGISVRTNLKPVALCWVREGEG